MGVGLAHLLRHDQAEQQNRVGLDAARSPRARGRPCTSSSRIAAADDEPTVSGTSSTVPDDALAAFRMPRIGDQRRSSDRRRPRN